MIVAGFGFRGGAPLSAMEAALALACAGLPPVTALAAPHDKAPALRPLAAAMGLPVIAVAAEALAAIETPTRSAHSLAARAAGSVAEASALAAAGPGAHLLRTRQVSPDRMATCAVARGTLP